MSGDRPDAPELIAAVAAWLTGDLAGQLEGGARFQAMVAAQGLAIAAREIQLGEGHRVLDDRMFAELGAESASGDPVDLCRAAAVDIAAGKHDDDLLNAVALLKAHVRRKLEIARPGYADSGA
ncbi:MAG: hypothetical protein QOG62_1775 [Thermoleophilaceae bacterium]|nr:hypothetical protein [Thermoleophilaceae bacterium]